MTMTIEKFAEWNDLKLTVTYCNRQPQPTWIAGFEHCEPFAYGSSAHEAIQNFAARLSGDYIVIYPMRNTVFVPSLTFIPEAGKATPENPKPQVKHECRSINPRDYKVMPTAFVVKNSDGRSVGVYDESLLRSFHILQKAKELLAYDLSPSVVLQFIKDMERAETKPYLIIAQ